MASFEFEFLFDGKILQLVSLGRRSTYKIADAKKPFAQSSDAKVKRYS